jgi:hypothetical protein
MVLLKLPDGEDCGNVNEGRRGLLTAVGFEYD